jgi:hypothetical protein
MSALKDYRSKGEQKMTVQHVPVVADDVGIFACGDARRRGARS